MRVNQLTLKVIIHHQQWEIPISVVLLVLLCKILLQGLICPVAKRETVPRCYVVRFPHECESNLGGFFSFTSLRFFSFSYNMHGPNYSEFGVIMRFTPNGTNRKLETGLKRQTPVIQLL